MSTTTPLIARNLTAQQQARVVGNPVNTTFDSGVANCFPGLEMDVRNLDRRFFPGLLFQYVTTPLAPIAGTLPNQQGIKLVYLDFLTDPMLIPTDRTPWVQTLLTLYNDNTGARLSQGRWYITRIEQGGTSILLEEADGSFMDGERAWRVVRSLNLQDPVNIQLVKRDDGGNNTKDCIELVGSRRQYVNDKGTFDAIYRPGELTQSMCNPWAHDFRDCACHYWASNHPDIVKGEVLEPLSDGQARDPERATTYLDWLRDDRSIKSEATSPNNVLDRRPWQIDHFQINHEWEEKLDFVLEGREQRMPYRRQPEDVAEPYANPAEMIDALTKELAPMELTLATEYLFALFSLKSPEEAPTDNWPNMVDDLKIIRQYLLLVATGEMVHLRRVNQLLWHLSNAGLYPDNDKYKPVIKVSPYLPGKDGKAQRRQLRRLTEYALDDFIRIEHPGGTIDRSYAKLVATLKQDIYPSHLFELAIKIDSDGIDHYTRFRDIRQRLRQYGGESNGYPYLRDITIKKNQDTEAALNDYKKIMKCLKKGYAAEAAGNQHRAEKEIQKSRGIMNRFYTAAEALAREGYGIPFWDS